MHRLIVRAIPWVFVGLQLGGCSTTGEFLGKVKDAALEAVGAKAPEIPIDQPRIPRKITLTIHPGENLNAGKDGQPLSLILRVYKVQNAIGFMQAPYESFVPSAKDKDAASSEFVEVRELQLVPGHKVESIESIARDTPYIGVVALFRTPAPNRWHFVFRTDQADETGIVLGAHACALTVTRGQPQESVIADPASLAATLCP